MSLPRPPLPTLPRRHVVTRATAVLALALAACDAAAGRGAPPRPGTSGAAASDSALVDTLVRRLADAYDFTRPGVVQRLMALYPDSGPVISTAAGRATTSRFALRQEVERFWQRVGQNMQSPRFEIERHWGTRLGPDAAVLTLEYRIPHHTPEGRPHLLGGAWTAVFERRDGRWVIVQEHLSDRMEAR